MIQKSANLSDDLRHRGLRCEGVLREDNATSELQWPQGYESEVLFAERLPVPTVDIDHRWCVSSAPTNQVEPLTRMIAVTNVPVTFRGFVKARAPRLEVVKNRWKVRD